MNDPRPKTIFLDIDGTLIQHPGEISNVGKRRQELLPGVLDKLDEWDLKGYNIILTTGRKECIRNITIKQLEKLGIIYDQLIMGIGGGIRVLINDRKLSGLDTAVAINLDRNLGIGDVHI